MKRILPKGLSYSQKKKFFSDLKYYLWEEPFLYKHYSDQIIRRCVPQEEVANILYHNHTSPVRVTLESPAQLLRSYSVGFTGPPFSEMSMTM